MNSSKFYLSAIGAYFIWGFFSLVLKPIHHYPSIDILFFRVFTCAVLLLVITLLFKQKEIKLSAVVFKSLSSKDKMKTLLVNIGACVFLMANWLTYIFVMNHVSVKATSLAYLVCPILTTVLAFFILKEKLSNIQWLAVGLSVIGCFFLSYTAVMDMVYSVVIGLTYACYLICQRVNREFDKFIVLTIHIVTASVVLLPFYPVVGGPLPTEDLFYGCIAAIAIFFTIVPLLLNFYALSGLNSSTVGMLLNINPIIAFGLAIFVFNETVAWMQFFAYGIIFLAVLIFNLHFLFLREDSKLKWVNR